MRCSATGDFLVDLQRGLESRNPRLCEHALVVEQFIFLEHHLHLQLQHYQNSQQQYELNGYYFHLFKFHFDKYYQALAQTYNHHQ